MISMVNENYSVYPKAHEYRGLSTDVKPIEDVPNGSTFYEMDTQDLYMFDSDASAWIVQ